MAIECPTETWKDGELVAEKGSYSKSRRKTRTIRGGFPRDNPHAHKKKGTNLGRKKSYNRRVTKYRWKKK